MDLELDARCGWNLKMEIVSPDDPDTDNGTKSLNYCIVIGPEQIPVGRQKFGFQHGGNVFYEIQCPIHDMKATDTIC
ncbi:hypothetical protein TNCV_41511 [Trichonephila clavipes]|nr:hypothetical protein TNCV_41511 [Trichonephila clavipes]